MSIRLQNGTIVASGPDGDFSPTAEEIYTAVFEATTSAAPPRLDAKTLLSLGVRFSDTPATPTLLISAEVSESNEPRIRCALAGKVGPAIVPTSADYVIIDSTWYPLPHNTAAEYADLLRNAGISDPASVSFSQYLEVQKYAASFLVEDRAAEQLAAGTLSPKIPSQHPHGLAGTPYPYQQVGLQWLAFMARHGLGSILADEMGLGKTLQVIAVFLAEVEANRRPNLVVCPATLLENWRRELARFAPSLTTLVHAGPRRTGSTDDLRTPDVTVASYETVVGDISLFRGLNWNVVALDEAQNIKNPDARRTRRAKEIPKRVGIAVTGTPVENRLKDLWSLCDFALPGHLGTLSEFEKRFPDTEPGATELEPLVSAIMLRRRVRDVAADLPPRIDVPVALVMDARSAAAYEDIRGEAAANAPDAPGLAALVHLRMFCAHPWTVGKLREVSSPLDCSPKLERCFEILDEIFDSKSKAILFTSFNEAADLLEREIARRFGVPAWKINGSVPVPDRQPTVDQFAQVSGGAALVLNPKAAGVGLNITAATHVIHYNLEWNPAVEDQASARAHRRGQTRPVTVHRLFYTDTVEEVINDRMTRKRALAEHAVVGTEGKADDLADILNALKRSPRIPS
jgi:SNF2 family DNA or RNA helicase